ncbi:MAG: hypothetical protein Q8P67_10585 [archaeon]|nr:hypothetical protein [archaeon]
MNAESAATGNGGGAADEITTEGLLGVLERRHQEIESGEVTSLGHQYLEETEVRLLDGSVAFGKQDLKVAETGGAVWEGAVVLAEFFAGNPHLLFRDGRGLSQPCSIVELGSGTGFCGAALAVVQARHGGGRGGGLVVSDMPPNVPLMEATLRRNGLSAEKATAEAHAWGEALPEGWQVPADVVVGTDLLYNPDSTGALLASLRLLSGPSTRVYLCWKERFRFVEQEFLASLAPQAFRVEPLFHGSPSCFPADHPTPMHIVRLIPL